MPAEFTGEQKLRIVLESIIRGVPREEQCKKYSITPEQFQTWHDHLIKNGGKIYEPGALRSGRSSRTKKVKFTPWYVSSLLAISILLNLGGGIVWAVWKMASPEKEDSLVDVFPDIESSSNEENEFEAADQSTEAIEDDLQLESLIKQVDEFAMQEKDLDPIDRLSETPEIVKSREVREMLSNSLKLPESPSALQLASEVEFLDQTYEGKHVVYLVDVGGYQLEGKDGAARFNRMKVALLESLTKLSKNSYFNLVLCWNLREAHALGKTILRASDENKKFASDWIKSIGTDLDGLKDGRNQFYPKELLYAKPLVGVVGPWYGLATAMSYDPDLVFFMVGNMPKFMPEEVSRLDFNGLGLDIGASSTSSPQLVDKDGLNSLIRKTAGYWLVALQSDRNLPSSQEDIEDIAMSRLGLENWKGPQAPMRTEVPWDKAFDNFLAGLELGIEKIPQVHTFQTLPDHQVWPSSLQNSMEEFCESSRGSLNIFP
ncbi:transposase [Opitutales bacterium]|nr:transposase [Opitutales bacterium]